MLRDRRLYSPELGTLKPSFGFHGNVFMVGHERHGVDVEMGSHSAVQRLGILPSRRFGSWVTSRVVFVAKPIFYKTLSGYIYFQV
jgi:hypothetical protein